MMCRNNSKENEFKLLSLTLLRTEPSTGDQEEPRIQSTQTTNNFERSLFFHSVNVLLLKRMVDKHEFKIF